MSKAGIGDGIDVSTLLKHLEIPKYFLIENKSALAALESGSNPFGILKERMEADIEQQRWNERYEESKRREEAIRERAREVDDQKEVERHERAMKQIDALLEAKEIDKAPKPDDPDQDLDRQREEFSRTGYMANPNEDLGQPNGLERELLRLIKRKIAEKSGISLGDDGDPDVDPELLRTLAALSSTSGNPEEKDWGCGPIFLGRYGESGLVSDRLSIEYQSANRVRKFNAPALLLESFSEEHIQELAQK